MWGTLAMGWVVISERTTFLFAGGYWWCYESQQLLKEESPRRLRVSECLSSATPNLQNHRKPANVMECVHTLSLSPHFVPLSPPLLSPFVVKIPLSLLINYFSPSSVFCSSWNVSAQAAITLVNQDNPKSSFTREIYHCFCGRENDWGFSNFMTIKVQPR